MSEQAANVQRKTLLLLWYSSLKCNNFALFTFELKTFTCYNGIFFTLA